MYKTPTHSIDLCRQTTLTFPTEFPYELSLLWPRYKKQAFPYIGNIYLLLVIYDNQVCQTHILHLLFSASQMWCLGRFLPILIGDKIPTECPYWDNYVSHLHIMDEMFAPITTEDRADYLAMLVEDFLEEFKVLYPTRPLTPKMHYLIHIPTCLKTTPELSNDSVLWRSVTAQLIAYYAKNMLLTPII